MYEHFRFMNKLLCVAGYLVDIIKLENFTLLNFDLIFRTSDEGCIKHHWCSTKFQSSYCMLKHFEKISNECLNL